MDQTNQSSPSEQELIQPAQTSIGLKLTLIAVGLLLFAFIIYSIISIRVGQGDLTKNLESDLKQETTDTISLIQTRLSIAQTITQNLATAVETGSYNEEQLQQIIQATLQKNPDIYGATVGYEPYKLNPNSNFWSPYYNRAPDGSLQLTQLGDFDYFDQEWYFLPKRTNAPVLSVPYRNKSRGDTWIVTWSIPFYSSDGRLKGVASTDLEFSKIQETFSDIKLGTTGYAFLLDPNGLILGIGENNGNLQPLADSMYAYAGQKTTDKWLELINKMTNGETGFMVATDALGNVMFISYAPVGMDTGWSLALVYPRGEILEQTRQLQISLTGYGFLISIVFGFIIFYFSRTITTPLQKLTEVAEEISSGNLNVSAQVESYDEVGTLAETINRMTGQLQDTLNNLERRITERTVDLEISRKQTEQRAAQLLAIGEISKIINTEQDLNILLPLITQLVSERFNFYHVGIFLIDNARQYAVLQAANSSGGQVMLKRGHKLKVGESGIVGFVAKAGVPRIALDVGQDAVFFNNPDLPTTRSEVALPLRVRERIIGILDVQSEKPGAFTNEDTNIFNILADQVAIAIENARLLEQTQRALEEAQSAYQKDLQEGWKAFSQEEGMIGYYQSITGGRKLTRPIDTEEVTQAMQRGETLVFHADGKTNEPSLVVPIKLREQIIGAMHIKAPASDRQWTQSEINLSEAVSERLSLALENARLIQESQRQLIKEQTITEITGRISSSINLENVLLTAVEELGRSIPGSEVTIKLKGDETPDGNHKE